MCVSLDTVKDAERLALLNTALQAALHNWYSHNGRLCAKDRGKPFDAWFRGLVEYIAGQLHEMNPDPHRVVKALEINAIGDKLALYWSEQIKREHGLETDINCYVEDGVVCSNVWMSGDDAYFCKTCAEEVAKAFNEAGYSAEVWVDEEDATEVTVNAQIDFALYFEKEGVNGLVRSKGKQ